MKTLNRYLLVAAAVVTFLVALKVLVFLPPADNNDLSERHSKDKGSLLWRGRGDGHDELQSFGYNNPRLTGEMGRGVVLPAGEKDRVEEAMKKFNLNVVASDLISLNRQVPDSRPVGCESVQYPDNLPGTAVVIPFHNEWPSVLLRTVYSIINRTPKSLLEQIILVDDASDLKSLKEDLDHFIGEHFPSNLVKLIRLPERVGLIRARLEGFAHVTSEVVSFFDSHMEVNTDWLQPLLVEIKKNRQTIAMGHLDYILPDTFEYSYTPGYRTRYGFDWRLIFFETYFLRSQKKDKDVTDPLPGVVMVGPGFAVNSDYFREVGTYDEGMKIWGGENLELAWRVWLCGGRLVHLACSKLGHIARPQPYSFPEGRYETEIHNYKRAVEVWMGPYKKLVYEHHPKMKDLEVGDLTERKALRDRLQCKPFTWYLKNVWPEIYPYGDNATHWGAVKNPKDGLCLDNNDFLFLGPEPLQAKECSYKPNHQSFGLTLEHKFRSVLQCVGVQEEGEDMIPILITCNDEPYHTWTYTNNQQLRHDQTGLCLQVMTGPHLVMQSCRIREEGQVWKFEHQGTPTSLATQGKAQAADFDSLNNAAKDSAAVAQDHQTDNKPQQQQLSKKSAKAMLDDFENHLKGMNPAPAAAGNMQMMQGGGPMQGGVGGGGPMMQGGPAMMQGGPPMMQGSPVIRRGPPMMQGGGPPMMMQNGPMMQVGGGPPAMMPQGGKGSYRSGQYVDKMQMIGGGGGGPPPMPGRGGGAMMMPDMGRLPQRGGGGGGMVGVGGGGPNMAMGGMGQFKAQPGQGNGMAMGMDPMGNGGGLGRRGGGGVPNKDPMLQEMVNRQLYAEAKRSRKYR